MLSALPLTMLALAATMSAQITTSIWLPNWTFGTDKIGFEGSVIDVKDGHTVMAFTPDNGTDTAMVDPDFLQTWTVAPTYFEASQVRQGSGASSTTGDENIYKEICQKTATGNIDAMCTQSYGARIGAERQCRSTGDVSETQLLTHTHTHTYPARGTVPSGVETVIQTFTYGPVTHTAPAWCTQSGASTVDRATSTAVSASKEEFGMYQVIITAGADKLDAAPTSSAGSAQANNPNAAVPTEHPGSLMAGLAIAAYFL